MGGFGTTEIIIISVVALVLFGPSKIPEFAKQCGRAVNMFKNGLKEGIADDAPRHDEAAKKDSPAPKA